MRYALVCLLLIVFGASARAEELEDRAAIQTEVYRLLWTKDFADLEAMADQYRTTGARTSSGLWKLTLFYVGIQRAFDDRMQDGGYWAAAERMALAWVDRYPESPTARLAYAQVLHDQAWGYRGGKRFLDYVEKTRAYLEAHKSVAAQDPRWYEMMAEIAYTQSWPRARFTQMIEEGLDRMPEYYPIYFAAVDYLSPRWGGSAADIERFAREAVERTRKTDGWGIYARIYWYASQTEFGDRLFTSSLVNWPDMKTGMDDVVRQYADGWNLANFVKFACLKGDGAEMKKLTDRMNEAAWSIWDSQDYSETCKALSAH